MLARTGVKIVILKILYIKYKAGNNKDMYTNKNIIKQRTQKL